MARITVKLVEPVELPSGFVDGFDFRSPTFAEWCEHPHPFRDDILVDGVRVPQVDRPALRVWAERLVVPAEHRPLLARMTSLADFRAVEEAIRGFFVSAETSSAPMPISSTEPASGGLTSIR